MLTFSLPCPGAQTTTLTRDFFKDRFFFFLALLPCLLTQTVLSQGMVKTAGYKSTSDSYNENRIL